MEWLNQNWPFVMVFAIVGVLLLASRLRKSGEAAPEGAAPGAVLGDAAASGGEEQVP